MNVMIMMMMMMMMMYRWWVEGRTDADSETDHSETVCST
jgi:hypothetical protein